MDGVAKDTFATCRDALTADRPHRLWSLIISVFGDLAQAPGSRISGTALGQITDLVGIKPEAMRVALHRLRKDGWIESVREGRASFHQLTEFGCRQCAEASPRIYGPDPDPSASVHLLLVEDGTPDSRRLLETYALTELYVQISGQALVGLGDPPEDAEGLFVVRSIDVEVPDWLKVKVCPSDLQADYGRLFRALEIVEHQIGSTKGMTVIEIATLRTLVVHSWRRVLLRHPSLPAQFFPDGWVGSECRALVSDILDRLVLTEPDALEILA